MPTGVMTPVFALLVTFLALDVVMLVAPYFRFRYTDDPWGSAERMEFLAKAMASALAFGLVASIAAERRNRSPWAFLLGHCGFWLAFVLAGFAWDLSHPRAAPMIVITTGFLGCVAVLLMTRTPGASPPPVAGVLKVLCHVTGACGNIWFGIVLMASIAVAVGFGTIVESMYVTAQVAQHYVYRSAWFGALFFTAGLSMLSATFRKWPFRLEQAGWLTVHTGLALVVIGSMASFLTKVEGSVSITEGAQVDSFSLDTRTRLTVAEVVEQTGARRQRRLEPRIDEISDFDLNPAEREPNRVYRDPLEPLAVTVDRFYGTGRPDVIWRDDGPEARAGIVFDVVAGDAGAHGGETDTRRLDELEESTTTLQFGSIAIPVDLFRASQRQYEAFAREKKPEGLGRIVVRDRAGQVVLEAPVEAAPGSESRSEGSPAALSGGGGAIPGTSIKLRLRAYYDVTVVKGGQVFDASPGVPLNPSVSVSLDGPDGEDSRQVGAFMDEALPPPSEMPKGRYPYQVTYAYEPAVKLDGPRVVIVVKDDEFHGVFFSSDGSKTTGKVEKGAPIATPMAFLKLVPTALYRKLRISHDYRFEAFEARQPVIRLTPSWEGKAGEPFWIPLGQSRAFEHDGRRFVATWQSTSRALGFSLHLHDFHRDFHPGSRTPSTFESYVRLVHPAKFPDGEDVKIDMNHPLRLDGWRLYQSRFDEAPAPGMAERTVLQVNRDPGLAITYPACAVVLLGLIVVLFMKKTLLLLRRKLEAEGATPRRHVACALAAVGAVGIGPAIFSVYVAIRPWAEQHGVILPLAGWPAFVFGLSLVAIVPIMVVVWFTRSFHRRLAALTGAARPEASP
jgi:ResB-like family